MVKRPDIQKDGVASLNQQLKAANQQLENAYRQLQEEEQQLRASNQQLIAANQELKETQRQLRQSRHLYEMLFNGIADGIAVYDVKDDGRDFIFKEFNPAGEKIDRIKQHEIIGKSILDVFPGVREFGLFDVFQRVWRTGTPEHHQKGLYKDDRISGWRENYVFKLPTGEIVAIYSDITERKQAEDTLEKAEKEKATILDTMSELVVYQDTEHRVIWANRASGESVGSSPGELLGRYCYEVWHGRNKACAGCPVEKALESGRLETAEIRSPDGRIWSIRANPVRDAAGNVIGVVEVTLDITERKQAEEKHQTILKTTLDGFCITDLGGRLLEANGSYCRMIGYTREELLGMFVHDIEAEESSDQVRRHLKKISEKGSDRFETRHKRKDGRIIDVEVSVNYLDVNEGQMFIFLRDITERKEAEEALRDRENLIRQVLNATPNPIFVKDKNGRYIIVNKTDAELHNTTPEEMVGKTDIDYARLFLASRQEIEKFMADDRMVIESKQIKIVPAETFTLPDGTVKWYQTTKVPISLDDDPDCVLGIAVDITERKKAEQALQEAHDELEKRVEQRTAELSNAYKNLEDEIKERQHKEELLRESEKFAAAGRLAAHVAHEINNPLAGIKNSFLLIKDSVPSDYKYYNYVGLIEKEIDRVSNIVRQMYDLYRPIPEKPRKFRFRELVEDVVALLKVSSDEQNVHIKIDVDIGIVVKLPDGLLRQVMFNLIKNAVEASSSHSTVAISAVIRNNELMIEVRDQGVGIPEQVREKIFEPFYTERDESSQGGLGLGLSVCRSIVDALEGRIEVQSRKDRGTVFTVYLPLKSAEMEQ